MLKLFSSLVVAFLLLGGCSEKDWTDDVNALRRPVPAGIVLMDAVSSVTAVKGTTFTLRFRVNPSGVEVTRDNLELDLQNSDTYFRCEPTQEGQAAAVSRASYVTPSDYYEIVGVEADRNDAGEQLHGQWVVAVATRGEGNFRNLSDLYLVLGYTDAAGVIRKISSPAVSVEIVPTADEGLEFRYPLVQNFRTAAGALNSYILQVDVNVYRNAGDKEWLYDRRFVTPSAVADGGALSMDASTLYDRKYLSFIPDDGNELWVRLDAGDVRKATCGVRVVMTDFGDTEKFLDLPVTYCPRTIVLRRGVPISELNANIDNLHYYIDLSAEAAEYGLTADMTSHLIRFSEFAQLESDQVGDFMIDEVAVRDDNRAFVLHAVPFFISEFASGFATAEEDAPRLNYSIASFPQESGVGDSQVLFDADIRIVIDGLE